jgi:serine/threonine protein kinase
MMGEVIAGYRLMQKLGEAGTGETYLAEHTSSGRKAAIKILFSQMCADAALIGRFLADLKAASLVKHAGIAELYDCGVLPSGRAFVICEHLQGKTLTEALIELGQVSDMESLADIAWQLATMLQVVHAAGIVHAALKPDGIFLTFPPARAPRPLVKLLDFGMAKFRLGVRQSQTGSLLGAPLYASPEIGRGLGTVDHRADIYALGCIMFEMACGRPPFIREGQGELIVAHATVPAPFVSSLEPSVPAAIDQLIGRMLTKNPLTRPQGMGEVAAVLEKFFKCPTPVAAQAAAPRPPVFPRPDVSGPVAPAVVAVAPALGKPAARSTLQLPDGWRPVARLSKEVSLAELPSSAEVGVVHPRVATGETEQLSPTPLPGAASATALLPPEPGPSWLAQVRQKTALITPGAAREPSRPVPEPTREEKARPRRSHSSGRRSVALPTASNGRVAESINVPLVVVSAAILLVIAAVLLLARHQHSRSTEKTRPVPAAVGAAPSPGREAPPVAPQPPLRPPKPSATEVEALEVERDSETESENGQGAAPPHRLRTLPSTIAPESADAGQRRRRW